MALQAGVQSSKVLILLGAGLSGSIVLRSGKLSELVSQLQELLNTVEGDHVSSYRYDSAVLAEQIRQLAKEIKELTLSGPVTIFNGNSGSNGGYSSYLVPAAALGAMGYCYLWWKGWSISDVMFVTKSNMANAVSSVSKQLETVSDTLTAAKRHLSKRLDTLDWKMEEQHKTSELLLSDVGQMRSSLSQIGFDVDSIQQMISGLEGKIELIESKQDVTNMGLLHLCKYADEFEQGTNYKVMQDHGSKLPIESTPTQKGLQFLAEVRESTNIDSKPLENAKENNPSTEKAPGSKTQIHRSYSVGISWVRGLMGSMV